MRRVSIVQIVLTLVILAGVVALGFQVTAHTLAAALAAGRPDAALALNPANARAILGQADAELRPRMSLDPSQSRARTLDSEIEKRTNDLRQRGIPAPIVAPVLEADERKSLREAIGTVLIAEPSNARALRMLALLETDPARQSAMMQKAASLSKHERFAIYWLMQDALLKNNYAQVIHNGDILMRTQPDLRGAVVPVMARVAASPEGVPALRALLRQNPPYRWNFLDALIRSPIDTRLPLDLFLDMKRGGIEPTMEEIDLYIRALLNIRSYELASYAWQQLAPANRFDGESLLYNGRFRYAPSGVQFDWIIQQRGGMRIEFGDAPNRAGERALHVEFIEGQAWGAVEQVLSLPPGDYQLKGDVTGKMQGRRGMVWRLHCADPPLTPIGSTQNLFGAAGWQTFTLTFTVPADDCMAQKLVLEVDARSDSERVVSGSLWFSNLELTVAP